MAPSSSIRKISPAAKRRKISLNVTLRVRNGGDKNSFISPSTPVHDGSSTEEEDNTEMENEFLNKMTDDTDRKNETVFGAGVEVWTSHGGTVYADINDKVKRKMREEEIWTEEAKKKVEVGLKRKMDKITKSFNNKDTDLDEKNKKTGKGKGKGRRSLARLPMESTPTTAYPPRSPNDTLFHHGSAGIDPLGAHNRPVKPLPKRRQITEGIQGILAGGGRVGMEGIYTPDNPLDSLQPNIDGLQRPHRRLLSGSTVIPPLLATRLNPETPAFELLERPNRIVSGSFGSFEGGLLSRFDERKYRLLPGQKENENKVDGSEATKPNPFKGRPWLR